MKTRTTWCHLGALTTAGTVAATILCCLPFATGIVGAGLAALGARFAPLRPYLTGISAGFLGYAFYQAYRPDGCSPSRASRSRRLAAWIVAVVVSLLLTASWWANWVIYWTL